MGLEAIEWLTLALVGITALYAWLTLRLVQAGNRAIRESTRALVEVGYVVRGNLYLLSIRNYGQRAARGVSVRVLTHDEAPGAGEAGITTMRRFLEGRTLSALAPGETHYTDIGQATNARAYLREHLVPPEIEIEVSYNDGYGPHSERVTVGPSSAFLTEYHAPVEVEMDNAYRMARALDTLAGTSPGVPHTSGGLIDVLRAILHALEQRRSVR